MLHFFFYGNDVIVMFCVSEGIPAMKDEFHGVITIIAFIAQGTGVILDHIPVHVPNKGALNTVFPSMSWKEQF